MINELEIYILKAKNVNDYIQHILCNYELDQSSWRLLKVDDGEAEEYDEARPVVPRHESLPAAQLGRLVSCTRGNTQ